MNVEVAIRVLQIASIFLMISAVIFLLIQLLAFGFAGGNTWPLMAALCCTVLSCIFSLVRSLMQAKQKK